MQELKLLTLIFVSFKQQVLADTLRQNRFDEIERTKK